MLCIFIVIPVVISVLAGNLYKYVYNTENMKIKPFCHDLGVGQKLTDRREVTQILTATSTYLMVDYSICRKVNSKRQVFSPHILNNAYQTTCPWKTQEQHSS